MNSKTPLEMFKEIQDLDMPDGVGITVKDIVPFMCEKVESALHRLESIDNANPSEALECLKNFVENNENGTYTDRDKQDIQAIKQALLKAQEPKQYLKWEDLEFSFKDKYMKVKLNGNIYTLRYTRNALMEFPVAYLEFDNTEITIIDCKKQFFNNLHLERVEE